MTPEEYLELLYTAQEAIVAQDMLQWRINEYQLNDVRGTKKQNTNKWLDKLKSEIMLVEKCLNVRVEKDISLETEG